MIFIRKCVCVCVCGAVKNRIGFAGKVRFRYSITCYNSAYRNKAAVAWEWRLGSIWCWKYEWFEQYSHSLCTYSWPSLYLMPHPIKYFLQLNRPTCLRCCFEGARANTAECAIKSCLSCLLWDRSRNSRLGRGLDTRGMGQETCVFTGMSRGAVGPMGPPHRH